MSSSSSSGSSSASAPLLLALRQSHTAPKVTSVSHQHHTHTCHLNYSHILLHNSTMHIQIMHFTEINIVHCYSRHKTYTLFMNDQLIPFNLRNIIIYSSTVHPTPKTPHNDMKARHSSARNPTAMSGRGEVTHSTS